MLLRSVSMLLTLGMITFAVMFGGGAVRLSRVLMVLGGFVMFVSGHFRLVGLFALPAGVKSLI
jgi:hypothetical protein